MERNLQDWLSRLEKEEERPNAEQMSVLVYAKDRIVEEIVLEKEGSETPRGRRVREQREESG